MNKIIIILILIFSLDVTNNLMSQNQRDIRINEVMSLNGNGPIDNFGKHVPWIEIFNSSFGEVNIAGMYISDNPNEGKYKIPAASIMNMGAQAYLVFFCNGNSEHGVLQTSFMLDSAGTIYLFSSNGRTLVDSVSFNFTKTDQVYSRKIDGNGEWEYTDRFTPNQTNVVKVGKTNAELFIEYDPDGVAMTLIGLSVVMSALAFLYLIFKLLSHIHKADFTPPLKRKKQVDIATDAIVENSTTANEELSGEINAAIAIGIHLYRSQIHDNEDAIITLKNVTKPYSPWNSKAFVIQQQPIRQFTKSHK